MARRTYEPAGSRRRTARQWFLWISLVVVVGLAVWQLTYGLPYLSSAQPPTAKPAPDQTPPAPAAPRPQPDNSPDDDTSSPAAAQTPLAPDQQSAPDDENQNPPSVAVETPTPTPAQVLLEEGRTALAGLDYVTARAKLSEAVALGLDDPQDRQARDLINRASDQWLFSPDVYAGDAFCKWHRVDGILASIARQNVVPYQVLARINNIADPSKIAAGKPIKVVRGPFRAVADRRRFLMSLYLGDLLVRSYPIGVGAPDRHTPTGTWVVEKKLRDSQWTDPDTRKVYEPHDPQNPLGGRWIALKGIEGEAVGKASFGIHGTIEPESIGTASSRGCIRMRNDDVKEVFDLLVVARSHVQVVN